MLPDRSKRYAGVDGEIPRLVLASNGQLVLIAVLVLMLLFVIFPRKALVEKLYEQEVLDELTLSYIQNLYRADTRNADIALLLAKSQQAVMSVTALEALLLPLVSSNDPRQRTEALTMLVKAYQKVLASPLGVEEKTRLSTQISGVLQKSSEMELPKRLTRTLAILAFAVDLPRLGLTFFDKVQPGQSVQTLEKYAQEALGKGNYRQAAEYYLWARDGSTDVDDARRLFKAGLGALMASGQFKLAMQAAEKHVGNLADDPPTLRYLARTALAAGDSAQAVRYAKKLVFKSPLGSTVLAP
jgi:polysaccharide biosynthesis protein PelB